MNNMKTNIEKEMVAVLGSETKEARFTYRKDEFNGELGRGIRGDWEMVDVPVEHPERDSEKAILFGNIWIPKSMIESMEYIGTAEAGPFEVRSIRIPRWLAIKNNL